MYTYKLVCKKTKKVLLIYESATPIKLVISDSSISKLPSKSLVPINKVEIQISKGRKIHISQDLMDSWIDTYPKEFLQEELKKARNWILSNPEKAPKSMWGKFFNSWFSRGWEQYRKTLKSNPVKLTVEDLEGLFDE